MKNNIYTKSVLSDVKKDIESKYEIDEAKSFLETKDILIINFKTVEEKNRFIKNKYISNWENKYFDKSFILDTFLSGEYGLYSISITIKDLFFKRVKPPRYIFHRTHRDNRVSIERNGLIPKTSNDYGRYSYSKPFVFASMNPEHLFSATFVKEKGFDVWVIDTTLISDVKWFMDFNFPHDEPNHIITESPIPAEVMKRIPEGTFRKTLKKYSK